MPPLIFVHKQYCKKQTIFKGGISMKKKNLTIGVFAIVVILPAVVAAAEKQIRQEPKNEQAEKIERCVAQQRRLLEDYYSNQATELRLRLQGQLAALEVTDRAVCATLAAQAEVAKSVLQINNYDYGQPGCFGATSYRPLLNVEQEAREFAAVQSRLTEKKNDILARFEWGLWDLERQKRYALTAGLAELENQLEENSLKAEPEKTRGMITGIVFSAQSPSALIDGQIVHEADTVHGVKVVKILTDRIEFGKNGAKWQQKVRQIPEKYW
jgi:hypothetical protein